MIAIRAPRGGATLVALRRAPPPRRPACGGGSAAGVTPPPGAAASIDAQSAQFGPNDVEVPAGKSFQLFFRNLDAEPHNVAILATDGASEPLFRGEVIKDAAITYAIPALPAGSYTFHCDVHPNMTGTIVAKG